ncbi:unnamed protein product [Phytomonas sp. Hart1]|nr:unnamed protein product [Phytomonas sp. Hart1]|eukprot:CCW66712.1 unnamed protein product [Phytomonas sp. isolate Hart1]
MLRNTASCPPTISIISSDGTRFVIPAKAAEYSLLLKSALERWTLEYLSQSSTAINNDDDEDDDDLDIYEVSTIPLHRSSTSEQSDMDSSSSSTSSSSIDDGSFANCSLLPRQQATAPPPTPFNGISQKDETGPHMGLVADSVASDNCSRTLVKSDDDRETTYVSLLNISSPAHEPYVPQRRTNLNDSGGGFHSVPLKGNIHEVHEPAENGGATFENTPSYFSAPSCTVCLSTQTRFKAQKCDIESRYNTDDSNGEGLEKEHSPTVVVIEENHADPEDPDGWFGAAPTEMPGSSLLDTPNERGEAAEDNLKDVHKVRHNSHSSALKSTNLSNSSDNRNSPQSEWKSPASVHQRTPVMLEDDDKVIIMGSNGQQEILHSLGRLSTSPCAETTEKPCYGISSNGYEVASKNNYIDACSGNSYAHGNNEQPPGSCADVDERSVPLSTSSDPAVLPLGAKNHADTHNDMTVDLGDIFDQAHITPGEILIDLRSFPLSVENFANSTPLLSGSSPVSTTASSHKRSASQNASRSVDRMVCIGEVSARAVPHYNGNCGTVDSNKTPSYPPKVPTKVLQLCVDYLLHFVQAAEDSMVHSHEDTPTALPMPLTAPLCSLLSPWERSFLYVNILGYDGSTLKAMFMINTILPDGIHYNYPGMALANKSVRDVLVMRPPRAEGMRTLTQVRKAAQELRIDSLHELCLAWMADFMIRASYGTSNNFEAAHLIQQCFGIQNEWTRKEMDCLRIENDWPANEEEC